MLVHFGRKPGRCEQLDFIAIELRVVIEDHIPVRIRFRKSFLQLLHHPFRAGMSCNVAVQNLPPAVLDDQERRRAA